MSASHKISLLFVCIFFFGNKAYTQERCRKVSLKAPITDTLTMLPGSFRFVSLQDTTLRIEYDFSSNKAIWKSNNPIADTDSIEICYRFLPFFIQKPQNTKYTLDTLRFLVSPLVPLDRQGTREAREEIFSNDSIQKTGSIYRGITVGNQQNAFVNSTLNLQLEGKLSPDISLKATLTDQNVPFQPEGNTQQVQQLDRVLIELASKNTTLQAGDVIFQNKNSEFMRFYKNVQGVQIQNKARYADSSTSRSSAGIAIAKGRFASTAVLPLEGVQGPYRLRGANNERFIVVIANTEQVYVDGRLLKRGFDADYVIDYNVSELTFNPRILITQYTRIRIDFEYTERNYSRTNVQISHFQEYKKATLFGQYYAETDNPRNPLAISLSDAQKLQLSRIGDSLSKAFVNSVDSVGFSPDLILYEKKDSLTANGLYKSILVFSKNPQKAFFQASFSEVGQGKGNYRPTQSLQNGRIFEWIEPIAGILQGNYEPISLLALPQKRQLLTAGAVLNPNPYEKIYVEAALSNRDQNRFSKINDNDNQGYALKAILEQKNRFSFQKYRFSNRLSYEWNSPDFLPIDRFRSIEFNRDWNLNLDTLAVPAKNTEQIAEGQIGLQKDAQNYLRTRHTYRKRTGVSEGVQHQISLGQQYRSFYFQTEVFSLASKQTVAISQKASWLRLDAQLSQKGRKIEKGYRFRVDKNTLQKATSDSVTFSAMNYDEHYLFLKTNDSSKNTLQVNYSYRTDNQPVTGRLERKTIAQTLQIEGKNNISATQSLKFLLNYRAIENFFIIPRNENNLMGRIEWLGQLWKKNIRSEIIWQNVSARELQKEFSYLKVPAGQGTHTWRDDNGDAIAQLNEFYLALNPDERQYAKIFTPTDTYIRAFSSDFNYRLQIQMPARWSREKGWKYVVSKFSVNGSALLRRKSTQNDFIMRLLPTGSLENPAILSAQELWKGFLFYNRGNPNIGGDLNFNKTNQKQLLSGGFEIRRLQEIGFTFRKNMFKSWTSQLQLRSTELRNESDFLLNRTFFIKGVSWQPTLAYQPASTWRMSFSYLQNQKQNKQSHEKATIREWSSEIRWSKASLFVLSAQIRRVSIDFNGEIASPVAYEMLEALQKGANWVWTASYQQKLANGLQINILYNGRKSPNAAKIIHFGQIQAGVLF